MNGLVHVIGGVFILLMAAQLYSEYRSARCSCTAWWSAAAGILALLVLASLAPPAAERWAGLLVVAAVPVPVLLLIGVRSFGRRALGERGFLLLATATLLLVAAAAAASLALGPQIPVTAAVSLITALGFPALLVVGWQGLRQRVGAGFGWLTAAGAALGTAVAAAWLLWPALLYGVMLAALVFLLWAGMDEHELRRDSR